MGRKARLVELGEREKSLLEKSKSKTTLENRLLPRIEIVLQSSQGKKTKEISLSLNISEDMVSKWRARWANNYEKLQVFIEGMDGAGVKDLELSREMLKILSDAPRSGCLSTFTLSQKEQIVAIACEKPEEYGVEATHWTQEELARIAIREKIVASISARHIGRILKKKR